MADQQSLQTKTVQSIQSDKKVLFPIGDAAEVLDTMYPFFRVQEEGFEAVVAGPDARVYPLVMHEIPPGWDLTREGPSYHLEAVIAFRDLDPDDYAGVFLTGGRAPEYIRYDEDLIRTVRALWEAGKPVCSVCHGAEIAAYARIIEGKRMATVPKCKFDIEVVGAVFVNEPCVVDGNLISGRTWHDHAHFMPEFIRQLNAQVK